MKKDEALKGFERKSATGGFLQSGIYDAPVASVRRVSLPTNEAWIWWDPDLSFQIPFSRYLQHISTIFNMF